MKNDNFVPMEGDKKMRRKIDSIIEERSNRGQFNAFDKRGKVIAKIEKELSPFLVVRKYFENLKDNQPRNAIDIDSDDRIWGSLLARVCNRSTVHLLIERNELEDRERVGRVIEANDITNAEVIYEDDLTSEGLEEFDLVLIQHKWAENSTFLFNQIVKLWDKIEVGGRVLIVSHKRFGVAGVISTFRENGLSLEIVSRGRGGVRLLELTKEVVTPPKLVETKVQLNFEFRGMKFEVETDDMVFSKEGLDEGTRFLLETVDDDELELNQKVVGDFGSGWGAISIVIAKKFSGTKVFAYEKDGTSFEVSKANLAKYPHVVVKKVDLTSSNPRGIETEKGQLDYIIFNPPFHVTEGERRMMFTNAKRLLKKGGKIYFVVERSFAERFRDTVSKSFSILKEKENNKYFVFVCRK